MSNLENLRELIQDDIMACIDGHIENDGMRSAVINRDKLKTQLCQIVVDRVNRQIENSTNKPFTINIVWQVEDIKSVRPNWSDERCEKFLDDYEDTISGRSIEEGWEIVNACLEMEDE